MTSNTQVHHYTHTASNSCLENYAVSFTQNLIRQGYWLSVRPVRVHVVFAALEMNPEVWLRPSPGTRKESQVLKAGDGD